MAKKTRQVVSEGRAYIIANFNNTIITITDRSGNALRQSSSGANDFRGSKKSTPFAAQIAATVVGKYVRDTFSMNNLEVEVIGAGPGRESALRALESVGLKVTKIEDRTPIPHNGCRPAKRRRV